MKGTYEFEFAGTNRKTGLLETAVMKVGRLDNDARAMMSAGGMALEVFDNPRLISWKRVVRRPQAEHKSRKRA